jgi:P2-related tail formation protein
MTALASSIANKTHLKAFDTLVRYRNEEVLPMQSLLVYLIDTVDAVALEDLAEQFDVMGVKGWYLCETEDQKRSLVKRAIELHRYAGTPWAVKEALRAVGFYNATIQEHIGWQYNGTVQYNGSQQFGASSWANFRVIVDIGDTKGVSVTQSGLLLQLITVWKSFRSNLIDLSFSSTLVDSYPVSEGENLLTYKPAEDSSKVLKAEYKYNGTWQYALGTAGLYYGGSFDVSLETWKVNSEDDDLVAKDEINTSFTLYNRATGSVDQIEDYG